MKYLLALLLITNITYAQTSNIKWMDPTKMSEQCIDGRGWNDGYTFPYDRLPQKAQSVVRPVLWDLSKHAAGEYINFTTNSSTIYVRLKVKGAQAMAQMPATAKNDPRVSCLKTFLARCARLSVAIMSPANLG